MNQNQQRVINYVYSKPHEPLRWNLSEETTEKLKELSLDKLTYQVVLMTLSEDSYTSEDGFQCNRNRWRSSLDIWRHIIYFKPEITILQVMNSLFNIGDTLSGHFCDNIMRRVFRTKTYGRLSISERDEYKLYWKDWNNIDKEVKIIESTI